MKNEKDINSKNDVKKIAQKLGIDESEIEKYTEVEPQRMVTGQENFEKIAGIEGKYKKVFIVNAICGEEKNYRFSFVGITQDGKIEKIDTLKTRGATTTDKTISYINRNGREAKEKQVTEMFTTNDEDKMFSVKIGELGTIEMDYIRRDRESNKFLACPVATTGQLDTTKQVKNTLDDTKTTNRETGKISNSISEQSEEYESGETNLSQVDTDKYNDIGYDVDENIRMHDGSTTTIRQEAKKQDISLEKYLNRLENICGECPADKIEKVNMDLEAEKVRDERMTPDEEAFNNRFNKNNA